MRQAASTVQSGEPDSRLLATCPSVLRTRGLSIIPEHQTPSSKLHGYGLTLPSSTRCPFVVRTQLPKPCKRRHIQRTRSSRVCKKQSHVETQLAGAPHDGPSRFGLSIHSSQRRARWTGIDLRRSRTTDHPDWVSLSPVQKDEPDGSLVCIRISTLRTPTYATSMCRKPM